MLIDLAEAHPKLVGPVLRGALLVIFVIVGFAFRCRDLEGKSSESIGKCGMCQVGTSD